MRHEKRSLAAAFLLVTSTLTAEAGTMSPPEQARAFATCAGRLAALATRQSATHDPASEITRRMETDFEALLAATLPDAAEAGISADHAFDWRIAGWHEIARLLRLRHHSTDMLRASQAQADMARRISTCTRLILRG